VSLPELQKWAEVGDHVSGFLLKLDDFSKSREVARELSRDLGLGYRVRDWHDVNENIFEAVKLEKLVIFCVILIIVMASAANVATSLYVSVIRKFPEISVLKAMGINSRQMQWILSTQGLLLGFVGLFFGLISGFGLGKFFEWGQLNLGLLPASVYRIGIIELNYKVSDLLLISAVTLLVCGLATLLPARKGARLLPTEGMRFE
jgi:lipoprotein-releasing system permease protein